MKRPPSVCASSRWSPIFQTLVNLELRCQLGRGIYESAQFMDVPSRPSTQSRTIRPFGHTLMHKWVNKIEQKTPVVTSLENRICSPPVEFVVSSNVDAPETIRLAGTSRPEDEDSNLPYVLSRGEATDESVGCLSSGAGPRSATSPCVRIVSVGKYHHN